MTEQTNIPSRYCSECGDWFQGEHTSSYQLTARSRKYPGVCTGCAMDIDERNANQESEHYQDLIDAKLEDTPDGTRQLPQPKDR